MLTDAVMVGITHAVTLNLERKQLGLNESL